MQNLAMMFSIAVATFALVTAAPTLPLDATVSSARVDPTGAMLSPAVLPSGAVSVYGFAGVPDWGAGFRQGFGTLELEARVRFDYLKVALTGEALGKVRVYKFGDFQVAPSLGLGVTYNSGSTYFDALNFEYFALRLSGGAVFTYAVTQSFHVLGLLDLPFDIGLSPGGALRFVALSGFGAEFYIGNGFFVSAAVQFGPEVMRRPDYDPFVRLGYNARIGLGARLF